MNKVYGDKEDGMFEFIDTSGKLKDLVDFSVEIIADGFGFLEGPVWINNSYLLFTEPQTYNIYKYDPFKNDLSLFDGKYEGCGNAIAWNKNYEDEIWIACMHGGHKVINVNLTTFEIIKEFNHKTYHKDRDTDFQPNDIIMDDAGNIYFTDLPIELEKEIGHRGGLYHINRETDKMKLIQLMEYAPNGISINNDQTILAVANFADVPVDEYDIYDFKQNNWDLIKIVGFKKNTKQNGGLFDIPYDYWRTDKKPDYDYMLHDEYDSFFDGSAFDIYDNLWQSVYFNFATQGGQISIVKNNGDKRGDAEYIGSIRSYDGVYTASNLEQGGDGYMYATCGSFDKNKGALVRFKLKEQQNEDNDKQEL